MPARRSIGLAAAAALLLPALALAQDPARVRFLTGVEYYTTTFDSGIGTKTVSEMVVPLGLVAPLSRRVTFDAGAYAVNARRTDQAGVEATLSGLTDVILRAGFALKPDVATLTVAVNLPTGKATLGNEQLLVAGAVATDLIPYPVSSFGTGFNMTTGLAVAMPAGGWAVGLAGSYRYNGEYQPLAADTTLTLRPGSEFRVRLGADRLVGQGRLALGVTYSTFSRDEFGADQARPGGRLISQISWNVPVGRNGSVSFFAWDIHRSSGDSTPSLPALKQNTVALGMQGSFMVAGNPLRPSLEFRHQWEGTASSGFAGAGSVFGMSARYIIAAGRSLTVVPGARFDVGSLPVGTGTVGFTGFSGSLGMRLGF